MKRTPRIRRSLGVESLERRAVLSTTAAIDVEGILQIEGDRGDNVIEVSLGTDEAGDAVVLVVADGEEFSFALADVAGIKVEAGKGDDNVSVDLTGLTVAADESFSLQVEGGKGIDTVDVVLDDLTVDGELDVAVELGPGDDVGSLALGGVVGEEGALSLQVEGGPGNDIVGLALNDLLVEGLVDAHVEGGPGDDALTIDGAATVRGVVNFRAEGGPGLDTLTDNSVITLEDDGEFNPEIEEGPQ